MCVVADLTFFTQEDSCPTVCYEYKNAYLSSEYREKTMHPCPPLSPFCGVVRLLVMHVNLAKLCTGKELSEMASNEEHGLPILYYYHNKPQEQDEAMRFALLCNALYNLPSTISSISATSEGEFDPTQVVHMDGSTLVFVQLEVDTSGGDNKPMILCVVQISRSGVNPLAIRESIQRSHKLFCLLRSGGIHVRLSQKSYKDESPTKVESSQYSRCPYLGMDQLFDGLRTLRRLQEAINRSFEVESDLELERRELMEQLLKFQESLPIVPLRKDLKVHYDAWIADLALASERSGGAGRCIVECIPAPIATGERSQWSPGIPPPDVSFHLGQTLKGLLSQQLSLLAVSTFFEKQLVFHHDKDGSFMEDNTFATLLMGYCSFYNLKMNQQHETQQPFAASTPPRRISQRLVSFSESLPVPDTGSNTAHQGSREEGIFLGPPPLAMLSASDPLSMVRGPNNKQVWAPLVYFKAVRPDACPECELVYAIFYEWKSYSFLFFVDTQSMSPREPATTGNSGEQTKEDIDALLGEISATLTATLNLYVGDNVRAWSSATQKSNEVSENGPNLERQGQDVIYIDRASSEVRLFPRIETESTEDKMTSPKRFLRAFRPSAATAPKSTTAADHVATAWAVEGLDCRHWLASQLSEDALRAFDDVINDAYCWRQKEREQVRFGSAVDGSYEILTTISQGWVYAFADGEHEIYILLDSNVFVTLADAHNSINQVRSALLPA